ncbi:5'-nucleotidase SurE [Impatiens glandulifera]|uniref:5'-nucleotidase SurE n=1 Tax=Impatiens glandulifera TaxID=253017 RepID=UPI001FB12746|nr:5'-nucleotidase SurE [Impatiens glandulifera]
MTSSTAAKKNFMTSGLVSNLEEVLLRRKKNDDESAEVASSTPADGAEFNSNEDSIKPVVLVTNGDGIESPGLTCLVEALVREGLYSVNVCAPQSDKSLSGHSVTLRETVSVSPAEINGATAYEASGTTVDCVSLGLSGALFSSTKPLLVISGINKGTSCGHHMLYSSVAAGAREALISGVPSISISLNWKKDESQESDFKDAVTVCLPLLNAALKDIEKGQFPEGLSFNIEVPSSPSTNKGFKLTKQSLWRSTPSWQAISSNRHPAAGRFMSNQQVLGMQLAQLSRDASAAGAARKLTTQRKNIEIVESVGVAGKSNSNNSSRYFRLEFQDKELEDLDDDLDIRALENGYVAVTPLSISPLVEMNIQSAALDWISRALPAEQ